MLAIKSLSGLNSLSKKNKISNTSTNTNANTNANTSATVEEALMKETASFIKDQDAVNNLNKLLKNNNSFSLNSFGKINPFSIGLFLYALVVLSILVNESNKVRNAKKDSEDLKRKSAYIMATRITVLTFCVFASFFLVKKFIQKTEVNIFHYLILFLINAFNYYLFILTAKLKNFRIFMYLILWCISIATKIAPLYM